MYWMFVPPDHCAVSVYFVTVIDLNKNKKE